MPAFTEADINNLLDQPGIFSYRPYGSSSAWTEFLGVNGARYDISTEQFEHAFDDVGTVRKGVGNEKSTIKISAGKVLDLDAIVDLTGGLFEKEIVEGELVEGATQVIADGAWTLSKFILLANQNGDETEPDINSVVGSVDGALVKDTDYFVMQTSQGWGIYIVDTGKVTTEEQNITINYDYTPAASIILKRGGKSSITPIEIRFDTLTPDGRDVYIWFYRCFASGNYGHGFGSENKPEPVMTDLEFTAEKDTSRDENDQLLRIVEEAA